MISLKTKLLTTSLVFFLALGITFSIYSYINTVLYQRLRLEGIRKSIKYESERANRALQDIERGAMQLAINGLLFQISQDEIIGETAVLEYLKRYPASLASGFWFKPYSFNNSSYFKGVNAYIDKDTHIVHLDVIEDDYDYLEMQWYLEIIDQIKTPSDVAWVKPYVDDTTYRLVITAGAGIFNFDNELIGISSLDWEMADVINALSDIKPTENSILSIYDPDHNFIITNTLTRSSTFPEIVQDSELEYRRPRIINLAVNTWKSDYEIEASVVSIEDIHYFAMSRSLCNGWVLNVYSPIKEIFFENKHLKIQYTLIHSIIAIIVMFVTYYVISKIVYFPIKKLISSVNQISLGNLNLRTDIKSNDEIGALSDAFNKMTNDLQQSIEAYKKECIEIQRITTELNIATTIQNSMLPNVFPPFPDRTEFDILAIMHPMREVGGDFYDFFFIDQNTLAFLIADVSDKGVPAALFMSLAKTLININANINKSPKEVFEIVNNMLYEKNDIGMFVTAFMGYYNTESGKLIYVNAGHNPPLINNEYLKSKPCPLLAWRKNSVYREEELYLKPNDILFLYTDGVTEAMNKDYELFSEERLNNVLKNSTNSSLDGIFNDVLGSLEAFVGGSEQADDITMLALKINHSNHPDETKLVVEANIEKLSTVIDFINHELDKFACNDKIKNNINIALEEVFVNIAKYSFDGDNGLVNIYMFKVNDEIVIRFEDCGKPFNLKDQPDPDLMAPISERNIGGLGIFLVQKLTDKLSYARIGDKNVVTMSIYI